MKAGLEGEPMGHDAIVARIGERFEGVSHIIAHGELTVFAQPEQLVELLAFCREDAELSCRLLADLGAVHWPAGDHVVERQTSTTGWPEYRVSRERGVVEVSYMLRSLRRNHWLRVSVGVDDAAGHLPSVTDVFRTANFHEREVFDFFGVIFDGHPDLTRILMPDDWIGHPQRKDYPLGGVDVPYKHDKFIPPPDERDLREVVE